MTATTTAPTGTSTPVDVPRFTVAGAFLEALAEQDFAGIAATVSSTAGLRALLPSGLKEWSGREQIGAAFARWFGDTEQFQLLEAVIGDVGPRLHLHWRLRLRAARLGDGWFVVEQQVYADTDRHGLISQIRLLCSGYCPEQVSRETDHTSAMSAVHKFDAGTLGCADGLAQEFRRQVQGIPLGHILLVETSDPAAKEDLPPLARLMGHKVHSVEPSTHGRLLITVERGK